MGYPSDDTFEEARRHRAPPRRDEEPIEPPRIHVTNVGPHVEPDPEVIAEISRQVKTLLGARSLRFDQLRAANVARLPLFKNGKGEQAHSQPDGSDWSDSDWLMAVTGELGELANLRKKVLRGDLSMDEARPMLADELADVATYLDILAMRMGIDLGAAVASKFNRVSERVGCNVKLLDDSGNAYI